MVCEQTCQLQQLWDSGRGDALLTQVLTPKGQAYLLFTHAPHTQRVGTQEYQEFWEEVWRAIAKYTDPQLTVLMMDANQLASIGDRPGRRMEEALRRFYKAHGLQDVTDVLHVPEGTYTCVKGTEKSRIDTAAVMANTKVRMMEVGYWGSSALSDWRSIYWGVD